MIAAPNDARVLVATDNVDDAKVILRQLSTDFENVRASTDAERYAEDFEEFQPHVLVLAFDSLEKAKLYYLGLYRRGPSLPQQTHRAVILCHKDELRAAFDLCKRDYFDDYVLYWPQTHDGTRLAMTIWVACREMTALKQQGPLPVELLGHAKQLAELETTLERQFSRGAHHESLAHTAQVQAEKNIIGALDEFATRLAAPMSREWIQVRDGQVLAQQVDALKKLQLDQLRQAGSTSQQSAAWSSGFQRALEPSRAETRKFAARLATARPVILVVEDDEFTRQLIGRSLDPLAWELVFAVDASAALGVLRRTQPDAFLMDVQLPGVDGLELTRRLKGDQRFAQTPIIVMTGDARRETLVSAMEAGASEFVVKPFTREALTRKIEKVVNR